MNQIYFIKILSCIFFISFISCKEQISEVETTMSNQQDFTLVNTRKIELSNEAIPLYSIGTVASETDIKISFKIEGRITDVFTDAGNYVKKGELLAQLHTTKLDIQILRVKKTHEKAKRDLIRIQSMYKDSLATLEQVEDLTTIMEISRSDVEIAELNKEYATIVAPVSGRLIERLAEPGEIATPGQPIFILSSNTGKAIVKASFSDKDIARLQYGNKAEIEFDAFPDVIVQGFVSKISESADRLTGTFQVDIGLKSSLKRMRNGYVGRVSVFPKQDKSYYKIPLDAIVEGEDEYLKIFIPDKNDTLAHLISVKPFKITSQYIAVYREGLPSLNRVITKGAPYLRDLDKIKIRTRS